MINDWQTEQTDTCSCWFLLHGAQRRLVLAKLGEKDLSYNDAIFRQTAADYRQRYHPVLESIQDVYSEFLWCKKIIHNLLFQHRKDMWRRIKWGTNLNVALKFPQMLDPHLQPQICIFGKKIFRLVISQEALSSNCPKKSCKFLTAKSLEKY